MQRPGFCGGYGHERLTGDGAVQINRRQLALLHGLLDRPDGIARSYADWARAARPYLVNRSPSALFGLSLGGVYSIPEVWVERTRLTSRVEVRLLPRGLDILELRVFCRVRGHGPYRGLRFLRSER